MQFKEKDIRYEIKLINDGWKSTGDGKYINSAFLNDNDTIKFYTNEEKIIEINKQIDLFISMLGHDAKDIAKREVETYESKTRIINSNSKKENKKQKTLVEFDAIIRKNKGVVRAMELEFNERAVYRELCDLCYSKDNVVCIKNGIPTLDELSEYIGLKSRTLSKHLISLEEKGLICRKNFSHKKMIYINPIYYTTHLNFDQLSDEVKTVFGDNISKYEIEEI